MVSSKTDVEKLQKEVSLGVDEIISGIDLTDIRASGIIITVGGKRVRLEVAEEQIVEEDAIRKELTEKFNEKLQSIRSFVNEKAMSIENVLSTYRNDYEKKEKALDIRLSEANIMPDITRSHSYKGLSVVKGGGPTYAGRADVFTWIYRTTYKPTRWNGIPLNQNFAKKMITPIIIELTTERDKILAIRVKTYIGDRDFSHYHNNCWGEWKYSAEIVKTPDDILRVCETASAVLDNINGRSLAQSAPNGLPRASTVEKNVIKTNPGASTVVSSNRADERAGLDMTVEPDSGWTT
jgi:predicted DNA binding CopG/RHH family protein